jgi:hypothetical protein
MPSGLLSSPRNALCFFRTPLTACTCSFCSSATCQQPMHRCIGSYKRVRDSSKIKQLYCSAHSQCYLLLQYFEAAAIVYHNL